jgi:DNA-binding MarR family transcriptional regulator
MERIRGYRLLLALLVLSLITLTSTGDQLWSRETGGGVDDVSTEEQLFETAADQSADDGGQGDEDAQGDEDPESSGGAAPESTRMPFDVDPTGMGGRLLPNPKLIIAVAAALVAVGIVTTLAGGLLVSEGVRTGLLLALVGPLLAKRLKGESGTLSRGRILGFIEAHPGIHFSALRDSLGLANGVTSHHLHRLEGEGMIISWADGIRRRYAVSSINRETAERLEHPVSGMQRAILEILIEADKLGITGTELRIRMEASRQLVSYHLRQLDSRELIGRNGRGKKARWTLTEQGKALLKIQTVAMI